MVCSHIHSWLLLSPDNIVVLHARTCTGTARQLAHLVAACHVIFSTGANTLRLAADSLPPLRPGGDGPATGGGGGGHVR